MKKRFLVIPLIAWIGLAYIFKIVQEDASANSPPLQEKIETIKVAMWDYEFHEYDKKLIEAFCEKYPNIKVEVISSPNVYYANKITAMLAGGEDIDVIYTPTSSLYSNLYVNHFVIPIDDLIERDNIDISEYRKSLTIDDEIYGLPYRGDWHVLYYNKDLFDKKNIPYPTNDMTWDEYRQLGKQLTSRRDPNKIYGILANVSINRYIIPLGVDGRPFDYINDEFENLRRGFELFLDIQFKDKSAVDFATHKSINSDQRIFEKGQTAMFINGTWFINYLINDKKNGLYDFEWGIVKIPHWGQKSLIRKNFGSICINIKTNKLEAAWTFVKFITGEEGAKILASESMLPAIESEEIYKLYIQSSGLQGKDLKAIMDNHFIDTKSNEDIDFIYIRNMVQQEIEQVVTGEKSIDQGIGDMYEKRRRYLEDKYKNTDSN